MTSILFQSGFKFLQTLKEFTLKYDKSKFSLDEELEKVWICHKICPSLGFEETSSGSSENYLYLLSNFKSRINNKSGKAQVWALKIFNKIFQCFNSNLQLATYILTECYLFYNWDVDSFEVLVDEIIVHDKISIIENKRILIKGKQVFQKRNKNFSNEYLDSNAPPSNSHYCEVRGKNFMKCGSKKYRAINYKSVEKVVVNSEPYFDIQYHANCLVQETFDINKILYDLKERPQWPKSHILSVGTVDDLLSFIIEIPSPPYENYKKRLYSESKKWTSFKEILREFLHNHNVVEKNNGYGRILKRHLKNARSSSGKLTPISKSIVFSYIFDILRRVVPLSLFGGKTCLRKKTFKQFCTVFSSYKRENFIWHPFLQILIENKQLLIWCREMNDDTIEVIMILKTFKFIIMDFVLLILKSNFYVTENGASGNNIMFYNKRIMEMISSDFINNLLYYQQIKRYRKCDHDPFTLERKWLETGTLDERDLDLKAREIMCPNFEFKQPVANVRFLPKNNHSDHLRIITSFLPRKANPLPNSPKIQQLEKTFKNQAEKRKKKLFHTKIFIDYLIETSGPRLTPDNTKLEMIWKKIIDLKNKFGKLYYVKTDIAEAFDSILHSKLMEILNEMVTKNCSEKMQLKKITQWKIRNQKVTKVELLSFSDRPTENAILINVSLFDGNDKLPEYKPSEFLEILSQIIMGQRLMIKGRIYKLTKGLAQGSAGRFSPQLCNLYYSSMDKLWFRKFCGDDSILLRSADDYLLVTSNVTRAKAFLLLVRSGIKDFNARFNVNKLQSNLIENVDEVTYLGMIYNFSNLVVKPNYSQYKIKTILSSMKLSDQSGNNHFNKIYFLEKKSLKMNSLKLQNWVIYWSNYNVQTIRQTIFLCCLVQSTRIMVLAKYLYSGKVKNDLGVSKVIFKSYRKLKFILCTAGGFSKYELPWLFFTAVVNTFKQCSGQYKALLVIMRFQLKKCEKFLTQKKGGLLHSLKSDLENFEQVLKN